MATPRPPIETARPVDLALRALTRSANGGRLWLGLAAVGLLVPGRTRRAALRGVGALAATSAVANGVLKPATRRRRPAIERTPLVRQLPRWPRSTSFPSGHAASAAAFTTAVTLERPAVGAALAPVAAAVAYSRVHVGVHHLSDVFAGIALGAGIALATQRWWPVRPARPVSARARTSAPALGEGQGLVVVVNPRSGTGDAPEQVRHLLPRAELLLLDTDLDLAAELDRRAPSARAFGVAGGDGTIAAVAAAALRHARPLAVFPAGTHNHFARDVGLESYDDSATALAEGDAVSVDVAVINGRAFVNTAVIGAYPDLVRRRDELTPRIGKWLATAVAAAGVLRTHQPVRLRIDGRPTTVWTLFIGNCGYTPRGPYPAWRPRLDDGQLDIQYLRKGSFSRTRTVLSSLAGVAQRSRAYRTWYATQVRIESLSGRVTVALDGEAGPRATEFQFGKLPDKLVVYAKPRPASGGHDRPHKPVTTRVASAMLDS